MFGSAPGLPSCVRRFTGVYRLSGSLDSSLVVAAPDDAVGCLVLHRTRGYVWISGGTVTTQSGDDGLAATDVVVSDGDVTVADPTGGGEGALYANGAITIDGGNVTVGGSIRATASGGEAR